MANLSSATVTTLVSDIGDLRKALEGTLVDQAQIAKRYDAATNGLLTPNGSLDTQKWENLTFKQKGEIEAQLSKLKQELLNLKGVYVDEDGPADEGSFMHKDYASNKTIIVLTVIAIFGLFGDLALICHEWEAATAGTRGILEFGTPSVSATAAKARATGVTPTPSSSPNEHSDLASQMPPVAEQSASSTTPSLPPEAAYATRASPSAKSPAKSPETKSLAAVSPATATVSSPSDQNKEDKKEIPGKVTEQAVLWMVILLGALGGFLYLASSMATYVGNRQLLRSWIIYYILVPFQGAALAPVIYLLLRVGVLNPANPTASGRPMESLNLVGIYAFAALTGLFSKQAIEMMADVFATIFKKVSAKDSLEKAKTDTQKKEK
jgi:hypothetical protein